MSSSKSRSNPLQPFQTHEGLQNGAAQNGAQRDKNTPGAGVLGVRFLQNL